MVQIRRNIAIDLGTASVLVYIRSKGVVLNEPSVVAFDNYTGKILAVGVEAKKMLGRTPGHIVATRPLKDGVIADFEATEKMLQYFIRKAVGKTLIKPNVIICVPSQATQVQKRAVLQASRNAGAYKTYIIEEPLAAAIGSGVDVGDPSGNMIVDIGGGTTDVAVIAMGGIVVSKSIRVAGDECDEAIKAYIRKKYGMIIGDRTSEDIKIGWGANASFNEEQMIEVRGRNVANGLPIHVFISTGEIEEALERSLKEIVDTVHQVLESTPPQLAADLFQKGVTMTGGGSLIAGIDKRIENSIGIPVTIADGPISAVVRGTGKALQWIGMLDTTDSNHFEARRLYTELQTKARKR
jgi:rod shape-determining protein MreB